jgi:hypothetical protein
MVSLRTVVPDGISVVDGDSEGRGRLSTRNSNEARVKAIVNSRTGARVATASDTMGTRVVVESDGITDSGSGGVRGED